MAELSREDRRAVRLTLRGVVQGVGFRPFVYGLAQHRRILGWVCNSSSGVEIHAEGTMPDVEGFIHALRDEAPPRSRITGLHARTVQTVGADGFSILDSSPDPNAYQLVSPDIATCDRCRRELLDPADRRHGYPFTNCTDCGPRFTIIEDLPYDRQRTTMRSFPLCPACRKEYEDPLDRRFHAEPNACPVCGPRVRLLRLRPADGGAGADGEEEAVELAVGNAADPAGPIWEGAGLLLRGEILAVQGLGGFHLACDATIGHAVRRLRDRKRRPHKPLAVMFRDVAQVREHCVLGAEEERLLTSPEHPIVLLSRNHAEHGHHLDTGVAPGQRHLGAMLPYTPLHILLLGASGHPLVMTSGNLAEEPIVKDRAEMATLATIADAYLVHDREIAARCDDSVALVRRGGVRLLRRSRGYAPLPEALPRPLPQTLGCGAELKNAFCLTRETDAFLAPHIGDLENLETLDHYEASVARYRHLFRVDPEVIGYDLHPEYLATKFALALPHGEKVAVQHHHAHVAARMVEHAREEPVIGVSMDGLGYGDDGRLWGGEFLVCDLFGYRRVAHLEELPLPGGAAAIRQPWRTAAGWSYALLGEDGLARATRLLRRRAAGWPVISGEQLGALRRQIDGAVNTPLTTSCGRLFDAVAALAGIRHEVTYEGQAAIELEMRTDPGASGFAKPYPLTVDRGLEAAASGRRRGASEWAARDRRGPGGPPGVDAEPVVVRLAPLFDAALTDLEADRAPGLVGARLHAAVAALVAEVCGGISAATGLRAVVLAGGVFQNRLLADLCEERLQAGGFEVLSDGLVPGNDGGIALGQAAVAGYTVLRQRGLLA